MKYLRYLILFLPLLLTACLGEENSELFGIGRSVTVKDASGNGLPAGVTFVGDHIYLELTPDAQQISIDFIADSPVTINKEKNPSWAKYDIDRNTLILNIDELEGYAPAGERYDELSVKVQANGYKTHIISIFIKQAFATYEQLLEKENKAIEYYLSRQTVKDWPGEDNIICGDNAPFYKLADSGVYMRVVSKGNHGFNDNDRVYFREEYYNLFIFMSTGYLGSPAGNMTDISAQPAFFLAGGQTHPYGVGIELPLEYGIGGDGEVYLVIPSPKSMMKPLVTPFLYHVKYHNSSID